MSEILNEQEVAELLDCAPTTVQELARNKRLPGVQFGRSWRFPRAALLEVVNRMALDHTRKATASDKPAAVARKVVQTRRAPPALPLLSGQA